VDAGRIMIGMSLLLIMIALIIHPASATGAGSSHRVGFGKSTGFVEPHTGSLSIAGFRSCTNVERCTHIRFHLPHQRDDFIGAGMN
jgi:hypothetical protein